MNKKLYFYRVLIILLFIFVWPVRSLAQEISLEFNQPMHHLVIRPDQVTSFNLTLTNYADPASVQLKIVKVKQTDLTGEIIIIPWQKDEIAFQLENNEQFEQPFFLASKQSKKIGIRVYASALLPEQDYSYAIVAQTLTTPPPEGETTLQIDSNIGSYLFVTVEKNALTTPKGKISLFSLVAPKNLQVFPDTFLVNINSQVPVILQVENTSTTYGYAQGKITYSQVTGAKNTLLKSYIIPPSVIFKNNRKLLFADNVCEQTNCDTATSLFITPKKLGIYALNAAISLDNNQTILYKNLHFIVVPFHIIIALVSLVLLLGVLLLILHYRYPKKS